MAVTSNTHDIGKVATCSAVAQIFQPWPPGGSPAYTGHIFGIYQQVVMAGAPYYIGARVQVQSNLNLDKWRELAKTPDDQQVVDFLTYGFAAGFKGELPTPSF